VKTLKDEMAMAICLAGCGIAAHRSDYFEEADAAILAFRHWLADEGLVVVPGDVTDEMLMSGIESDAIQHPWEALDVWRRMIATAPDALKGD
jgi:hypothetical protein